MQLPSCLALSQDVTTAELYMQLRACTAAAWRRLCRFVLLVLGLSITTTCAHTFPSHVVTMTSRDIQEQWASKDPLNGIPKPSGDISSVKIYPASHAASPVWMKSSYPKHTSSDILDTLLESSESPHGAIIQSSIDRDSVQSSSSSNTPKLRADTNGFINSAISAYNSHHHLILRPEDIWLAILTQFSSYVNAHSEDLRGSFVAHKGKKELKIVYGGVTRHEVDWSNFASQIGRMIQENVVDAELREWILPSFSTTEENDRVVANVVMMATLQKYFDYSAMLMCGIPSVTLLGIKEDYEDIIARIKKLGSYGEEPAQFARLLKPVLERFVLSFERPEAEEVKSFWNRIFTSRNMGSGPSYYSGWITAFAFWNEKGSPLYARDEDGRWIDEGTAALELDGVRFHRIESDEVPYGFATVPVQIDDNGHVVMAEMLAGSIANEVSSSGLEMARDGVGLDTLQPKSGWLIYEKNDTEGHVAS